MKTECEMKAVILVQKLQSNRGKHNWYHTVDTDFNAKTQTSF